MPTMNNKKSYMHEKPPLVSIITVVRNSKLTISDVIESVASQTYPHIEHIIVDGSSMDGTIEIIEEKIKENKKVRFISEPDNGIYDAINKGIRLSSGDIVGILNADDVYYDNSVIETVVSVINRGDADSCYGDIVYVDYNNTSKVFRYWKSSPFVPGCFRKGWQPPHPAFFAKSWLYQKYGGFNVALEISADYELMLRFFEKHRISTCYVQKILVRMRKGGISNKGIKNIIRANWECYRAWKMNDLPVNPFTVFAKLARKLIQFLQAKQLLSNKKI